MKRRTRGSVKKRRKAVRRKGYVGRKKRKVNTGNIQKQRKKSGNILKR